MQFDRDAALQASFDELAKVVRERFREGRSTVAAALKAELQRRFAGRFDQTAIGYVSFRDFLKDAEARSLIRTRRARGGDVEAVPPDVVDQPASASTLPLESSTFVRPDVWRAFVDWRPNWVRAYDLQQDRAVMYPASASPFDAPEWIEMRRSAADFPDRFKAIEPIAMDVQLRWITDFVETIADAGTRDQLKATLDSPRPFGAFARALQAVPEIKAEWNRTREAQVLSYLRDWMDRNKLTLNLIEERPSKPTEGATAPSQASTATEQQIRAVLHAAIDRMPLADLR